MKLKPIPKELSIRNRIKLRKEKSKLGRAVSIPKSPEVVYRNALLEIYKEMVSEVEANLIPLIIRLEPQFVSDSFATTLEEAFDNLRQRFNILDRTAKVIVNTHVSSMDSTTRDRFFKSIEDTIGVNLQSISRNEGIEDILISSTRENVKLIKSIPNKYFDDIERIVFNNTIRGDSAESMIESIRKINNSTEGRARVIARDQTSKLNAALTQKRQENLGIEEYTWRTAGDGRVRDSHDENNGKIFRWDSPPKKTGHPGEDVQCRCIAQPIIKF